MQVRVKRPFHEAVACPTHRVGAVLQVTEARARELISAGYCEPVDTPLAEEQPKQKKAKKKKQ